jgi:hypothetical protein
LARRQHGVVSTRQLKALGYGRNSASKANGVGRLHRVHRGVYRVGYRRLTWEGRCMAAVLAAAPNPARRGHSPVVASHYAAAWLWDLLRYRPETIHVTVPSQRRARRPFAVHVADLAARDRALREGIPVTSLPRTLLDLAAGLRPEQLASALQRGEERKLLDLRTLDEVLARTSHHPGASALRRALDIYRPTAVVTRSDLERDFLALVLEAGLPPPRMNFVVAGMELDAFWPERAFAVELDVFETHGSRRSFEEDRVRQESLLLAGIATIRVTGARLGREPEAVLARLARLLAERPPSAAPLD